MNEDYLKPTEFIDSDSPVIRGFAEKATADTVTPREKAVKLYYAVRDTIYYDPYRIDPSRGAFRASTILGQGYGYCVAKTWCWPPLCAQWMFPANCILPTCGIT